MTAATRSFASDELAVGGVKVVRAGGLQAAVFRLDDGQVVAVDNRCPHEGYPLASGLRSGATLTCCWHNYKFDLTDGRCLKGDEDVRTYAVEERGGEVHVTLAPPDPAVERPRAWDSLATAVFRGRTAQALRDTARLLSLQVPATELLAWLAAEDGRRSEWGATHVLPVTADLAGLPASWLSGVDATVPLSLAVEMVCDSHPRREAHPEAPAVTCAASALAEEVARAVEAEDVARAEGLVRGALRAGRGRAELEPALMAPVAAHFLDFGHAAIYQSKVFDLLDAVGWRHADDILVGFVRGLVYATREDTLPAWRRWNQRVDELSAHFPRWRDAAGPVDDSLVERVVGCRGLEAVEVVAEALQGGAAPSAVADRLIVAAAERVLRFDPAIDLRLDVQDSWLSVSHILTFAVAVHTLLQRWSDPRGLRWLLMAARMIGHHRVLDGAAPPPLAAARWDRRGLAAQLEASDHAALATVVGGVEEAPAEVRDVLLQHALDDGAVRPIVVAHLAKMAVAGVEGSVLTGDPRPAAAAARMALGPIRERRVRRWASEAVALVRDGAVPKLLAP